MKKFVEWVKSRVMLEEDEVQCENCGHQFHLPDWVKLPVYCPNCNQATNDARYANPHGGDPYLKDIKYPKK